MCIKEAEKLTLENAKLAEENQNLQKTVEVLQKKAQQTEASLEEKSTYLLRLADEVTSSQQKILTNEQLLSEASQKVCVVCVCVWCGVHCWNCWISGSYCFLHAPHLSLSLVRLHCWSSP